MVSSKVQPAFFSQSRGYRMNLNSLSSNLVLRVTDALSDNRAGPLAIPRGWTTMDNDDPTTSRPIR